MTHHASIASLLTLLKLMATIRAFLCVPGIIYSIVSVYRDVLDYWFSKSKPRALIRHTTYEGLRTSGLTHECWLSPPDLEIMLKCVSWAVGNSHFWNFLQFGRVQCMISPFLSFLDNSPYSICGLDHSVYYSYCILTMDARIHGIYY